MIVNELSKELGVKNKELIDFLKSKGYKISSHMQSVDEAMIKDARDNFAKSASKTLTATAAKTTTSTKQRKTVPPKVVKKFAPDDLIPCRSIVPWYLETVGLDKMTTYKWPHFGDIEYVAYRDLQSWRRKPVIIDAMIMIEDPDICDQWKHDIGNVYQKYLGVNYPEEFFEKSDEEFEKMLNESSDTFKSVIEYTAMDMIRNENYPSLQKLVIIDNILGTGIKEFI